MTKGGLRKLRSRGSMLVEEKAVMGDFGKGGWFVVCTVEKIVEEGRKVWP